MVEWTGDITLDGLKLRLVASPLGLREIRFEPFEPSAEASPPNDLLRETTHQLQAYFAGSLREFRLPLDPQGTSFQLRVWAELLKIPYGETRSYSQIAAAIERPSAVRAVGAANGHNPLPLVVPCHRVIGAGGQLTGYGGGLPLKRRLLALEGSGPLSLRL